MPNIEDLRERFLDKLKELFRLDQPDLDFGFYRIMHARAGEIQEFIENDLLRIITEVITDFDESERRELEYSLAEAIETAKDWGAPNPAEAQKVKEIQVKINSLDDRRNTEAEVYDHLYRFFERYYERGDFLSKRYYTRETSGRASPFAIPYNGEEVKLHWANADQYYTKSTEYFTNFTFDLWHAKELRENGEGFSGFEGEETSLKVHFRVVQASEGEHGNIKATLDQKRYFVLHKQNPVELTTDGELCVNFEYRPDSEKTGQETHWRKKRNLDAVTLIFTRLETLTSETREHLPRVTEYLRLLQTRLPTEKVNDRTLLSKYVDRYTERNTMDYFIHKDLGNFLRRELDFYIKNEILILDGIDGSDSTHLKRSLEKIKIVRKIASKIIDFLAQLENFQKKLWLKKKFVVETNYCITLDRVAEEFYPEICANVAQRREWNELFALDEESESSDSSSPLCVDFLKNNKTLMLDTRFFGERFKEKLLDTISDFDEQCDGLLVHSESVQALNFLKNRLSQQVSYAYLDPPFNTNDTGFMYKNQYKHSSWGTMVQNHIVACKNLLSERGTISVAIDDLEQPFLALICDTTLGSANRLGTLVVQIKPSGRTNDRFFATCHEYLLFYSRNPVGSEINLFPLTQEQRALYSEQDEIGAYKWRDFLRTGGTSTPVERPNSYYPIFFNVQTKEISLEQKQGFVEILPEDSAGQMRVWRKTPASFKAHLARGEIKIRVNSSGKFSVHIIDRIKDGVRPKSVWIGKRYDASAHGTKLLKQMFGGSSRFSFPKSLHAVFDCVYVVASDFENCTILDSFAGSGTTGHAVIDLNRSDGGSRKYVLLEMGDYFNNVLRPRMCKAVYSTKWKGGQPSTRNTGVSHCFKYFRLESYEDSLNNIEFNSSEVRSKILEANPTLREDYVLRYWLDVESRGSESLLNVDAFKDPRSYTLKIKPSDGNSYVTQNVDLIETFNYLIGLRVRRISVPQSVSAFFEKVTDPELPEDQNQKLVLERDIQLDDDGQWWFRVVEGWVPKDPHKPNDSDKEEVLIIWRNLTGDIQRDNLVLNEWFKNNSDHDRKVDFESIYVNGSTNLMVLKTAQDRWRVYLTEETFFLCMWDNTDL